jgi:chromosome segregation ATPase
LKGKERIIGDLLAWTRKQEEMKRWFIERDEEHKKYIQDLLDVKEWFLKLLENHKAAIAQQQNEIARQNDEITRYRAAVERLETELTQQQHVIDQKNDELNSIYFSKQWKIASAIKEAKHSLQSFIKLPFKIIRNLF